MGRSVVVAMGLGAAVWILLCAVAAAALAPLPLSARVIQRGELSSQFGPYMPVPATSRFATARLWATTNTTATPAQISATVARLEREGFKTGLTEQIGSEMQNWAGLSWVLKLGSPASARAELAATISQLKSSSLQAAYTPFAVKTIPGAIGYTLSGSGGAGDNIMFADGDYLYEVGFGWTHGTNRPAHSILLAGATKLYDRVHGHP